LPVLVCAFAKVSRGKLRDGGVLDGQFLSVLICSNGKLAACPTTVDAGTGFHHNEPFDVRPAMREM
jgi:hypothetical protein